MQGSKLYTEAIAAYTEAIRIDKNFTTAYFNLGLDYKRLERYDEAITALEEVIKLDPKYTNAYYNLSLIYYNLGNKETAMKEYEIVKELNANLAENLLPLISK